MNLQNAVAIVTGGTGGLGRRICHALAIKGVRLAVGYAQRQAEGEAVAGEMRRLGAQVVAVGVDVTQPASVQSLVDRTLREFGRIDILVNDAAYNKWIPFAQLQDLQMEN